MAAPILNSHEQREALLTFELSMHNFNIAAHVASLLILHQGQPAPGVTITFTNALDPCVIQGEKCGLFTNPVIQVAILDCRRLLEFFGISCDESANQLTPLRRSRRPDDLGIEHFGLPLMTVAELLTTVGPIEQQLVQVHKWSNKQLAHFTKANRIVMFDEIRVASLAMIEALLRLLYDRLNLPRPHIPPGEIVEIPDVRREQNPPP